MRITHNQSLVHLDLIRSFIAISEHGSLNQAAAQLRVSQSTLTRQMNALEHQIGGKLIERSSAGVALTAGGHALLTSLRPILQKLDTALAEARRHARGQTTQLRIGYIMSAASEYLTPALSRLRKTHPEVKVKLLDLSPGQQMAALRQGQIDVALVGHPGPLAEKEFFQKRIASGPVLIALAADHPLAKRNEIALSDLRNSHFIGAAETDLPGYNRWVAQLCRKAGFRARFVDDADSIVEGIAMTVTEHAALLIPAYAQGIITPGVVTRPLKQPKATWDLIVAWQRGKPTSPVRTLIDALTQNPASPR